MKERNSPRGKLTLSGVAAAANGNQAVDEDTAHAIATMSGNVQRNQIMIAQIIKPQFSTQQGGPDRVEAIAKTIAPVVALQSLNAEEIASLALFADKVMPGQAFARKAVSRLAA